MHGALQYFLFVTTALVIKRIILIPSCHCSKIPMQSKCSSQLPCPYIRKVPISSIHMRRITVLGMIARDNSAATMQGPVSMLMCVELQEMQEISQTAALQNLRKGLASSGTLELLCVPSASTLGIQNQEVSSCMQASAESISHVIGSVWIDCMACTCAKLSYKSLRHS